MRNKFDHQLEKLNLELITMGALCEDAISASVKGLLDDNDELCQKAVSTEEEINRKERDIESICMKLLLEQQPVARDLRVISSALKMISDMERIGDQAYDIAEIAKFIRSQCPVADFILQCISHFGICLRVSFGNKDRIISKAGAAASVLRYFTFYDAFEQMLLSIDDKGENGTELCLTVLYAFHVLQ